MNQLQSRAADCRLVKMLLRQIYVRIDLSSSLIHIIKEYRDYGKTRRITHDHGNNINSIGAHVRNKI